MRYRAGRPDDVRREGANSVRISRDIWRLDKEAGRT